MLANWMVDQYFVDISGPGGSIPVYNLVLFFEFGAATFCICVGQIDANNAVLGVQGFLIEIIRRSGSLFISSLRF